MSYKGQFYDLLTDKGKKEVNAEFNELLKDYLMIFIGGLIFGFIICLLIK